MGELSLAVQLLELAAATQAESEEDRTEAIRV
jgi:hypothetical protein